MKCAPAPPLGHPSVVPCRYHASAAADDDCGLVLQPHTPQQSKNISSIAPPTEEEEVVDSRTSPILSLIHPPVQYVWPGWLSMCWVGGKVPQWSDLFAKKIYSGNVRISIAVETSRSTAFFQLLHSAVYIKNLIFCQNILLNPHVITRRGGTVQQ